MSSYAAKQAEAQARRLKEAWFQMKDHEVRRRLLDEQRRFKLLCAGRRSGKTEDAKRDVALTFMEERNAMLACGAPTHDQAFKIWWKDLVAKIPPPFIREINKAERRISSINGTDLFVLGLDKPQRWEGIPWLKVWCDEFDDVPKDAWEFNIMPALDTKRQDGRLGTAWLFGVPEGMQQIYDLKERAARTGDKDWGYYTWKSAVILSPEQIEAARNRMSPRAFRQEYEASFETMQGLVYADYSDANHTDKIFTPSSAIIWTHDFNYAPLSSAVIQMEGDVAHCVDEIVLESAIARQAAEEFSERYGAHKRLPVIIYGDASGKAGEKHGHASDYTEMVAVLKKNGFEKVQLKVPAANGSIKDGQNSLRNRILSASGDRRLLVNATKCPTIDRGLKTTQLMPGSTFQEKDSQFQHITTALRYFTAIEWPHGGKATVGNF